MKFLTQKVQDHYARDRVLADFGIRIIGVVGYTSQIPGFIDGTYGGQKFGDAYLISPTLSPPWDTLIWTRRTASSSVEDGIWVDLGELAIPGPQGIQGETGPQGPQGDASEWYVGGDQLPSGDFTAGDMALLSNGTVYRYDGQDWRYVTSIRGPQGVRGPTGPQGIQGIQGEQGPAGPAGPPASAIRILGALESVDYLPDPSTLSQADGVPVYLIVVGSETRLYFIQGVIGAENWGYIPFTGQGTIVTASGNALSAWDADTKVNASGSAYKVYITDNNGVDRVATWTAGMQYANVIPRCDSTGHQSVLEPTADAHPSTKAYVDALGRLKVDKTDSANKVYGTDASGGQTTYTAEIDESYGRSAIPLRTSYGNILVPVDTGEGVPEAQRPRCAASKKYVDDALAALYPSAVTKIVTLQGPLGGNLVINLSDLPGIIPNTKIDLVASISHTGITSLPTATLAVGGNSINNSTRWTVPPITPEATRWAGTFFSNGSVFFVVAADTNTPTAISGGDITIGVVGDGGGLTTATITYLSTP